MAKMRLVLCTTTFAILWMIVQTSEPYYIEFDYDSEAPSDHSDFAVSLLRDRTKRESPSLPPEDGGHDDAGQAVTQVSIPHKPLLGENGTGIRKNISLNTRSSSSTQRPLLLNIQVPATPPTQPPKPALDAVPQRANDETISIDNFGDLQNKTLVDHNISKSKEDTHVYYNSTVYIDPCIGQKYWVDLDNRSDVKVNDLLSASHRRAATIQLSFEFPFYGHLIRNVTIATGGFLYTGDYVHSWLAATQYIAPLMANFDTSISNDSMVKFLDTGNTLTVQWDKVHLQDKPLEGEFTFQVTLNKTGDIVFVYKNVPVFIEKIIDDHHPVKVGLSDAYIIDRTIIFVRRKTIYEYHRVQFNKNDIKNWTAIYLTALPTCRSSNDCQSCISNTKFNCSWCSTLQRCSTGTDRNRQEWLSHACDHNAVTRQDMCSSAAATARPVIPYKPTPAKAAEAPQVTRDDDDKQSRAPHPPQANSGDVSVQKADGGVDSLSASGVVTVLLLVSMVSAIGVWLLYAYRNPHSFSGQLLIRYRPSQWGWRRGEARYTAATIHM